MGTLEKSNNGGKIMDALRIYKSHEQDYRNELVSIQREIECWVEAVRDHGNQRLYSLIIEDLKERVSLLQQALQRPELLPLTAELRNPFNIPPTPVEIEFLKAARQYLHGLERKPVE